MLSILIAVLAVIFVLGVAINIHEFGHFIVAKVLGMRVDAYSFFGLGPRLFGFKVGHTDYRVSAIPLGAYVKLYGDESNSGLEGKDEQADAVPASELYELRPRWQKFLVMIGGPTMNILLALGIPFTIAMMYGVPTMPAPIIGSIVSGGVAEQAGLQIGDRITSFGGIQNPTSQQIFNDAALSPEKTIPLTVDRNGAQVNLNIVPRKDKMSGQTVGILDFEPDAGEEPVVVGTIQPNMPAAESGLQSGDRILALNSKTIRNRDTLMSLIKENKDAPIRLTIDRNGERQEIETRAKMTPEGVARIGIGFSNLTGAREPATLGTATGFAWNSNMEILRTTGKAFGQVGTGERSARDTVSGPIGIVQIISQVVWQTGWAGLLPILMVISLNLGIFNLLPIPMLDGGQIMVLAIEGVLALFGMQLSMLVRERIQMAGLGIILLLMVFVIFNDVSRIIGL